MQAILRNGTIFIAAGAVLCVIIDAAGVAGLLPGPWSVVSYVVLAAVIVAGSLLVLLQLLQRRSGEAPRSGWTLFALALLLAAWLLRGHHEIPPDRPLIAATAVAAIILVIRCFRR